MRKFFNKILPYSIFKIFFGSYYGNSGTNLNAGFGGGFGKRKTH